MDMKTPLLFACSLLTASCGPALDRLSQGDAECLDIDTVGWKAFLEHWNEQALIRMKSWKKGFSDAEWAELDKRGLFRAPATQEQIDRKARELGRPLPPSYVDFLKVSNGWHAFDGSGEHVHYFPIEQVGRYEDIYPGSASIWQSGTSLPVPDQDYFIYGPGQDPVNVRFEYLSQTVAIRSEVDANVILLNPNVIFENGEWEAWDLASQLAGAIRYPSFAALMEARCVEHLAALAR
ncbi:SMI1/KNR4 family protein [Gallaecimonas sp. GXIMD4217]|uniref:SMI1/KNR4 family protein n=1 Tax=Gallaecimonas sp. GXIMD4217 TaxID=3131927 RepID=UPI00311B27B4